MLTVTHPGTLRPMGVTSRMVSEDMRPRHIILAEDDQSLRELLAIALETEGHRVFQVTTGEKLIDKVRRICIYGDEGGQLDLLVSDVRMPRLDGLMAVKMLRDAEVTVPMILITAFGDLWTRQEAARYGAQLLDKPISIRTLRDAVRNALFK